MNLLFWILKEGVNETNTVLTPIVQNNAVGLNHSANVDLMYDTG